MANVIGGDAVILYGLDSNGVPVPLKLNSDGTLSASNSGNLVLGSTPSTQAIGDTAAAGASLLAAPELHKHGMPAFASPAAIAYAIAQGVATTLPRSDHVHSLGLSNTSGVPATDPVALSSSNTWFDIMSVSCVSGTWLIISQLSAISGANGTIEAKIYDATTPSPNAPVAMCGGAPLSGSYVDLVLVAIVTPVQTTTYTVAALSNVGTAAVVDKTATFTSAAGPVTQMVAVRIG